MGIMASVHEMMASHVAADDFGANDARWWLSEPHMHGIYYGDGELTDGMIAYWQKSPLLP